MGRWEYEGGEGGHFRPFCFKVRAVFFDARSGQWFDAAVKQGVEHVPIWHFQQVRKGVYLIFDQNFSGRLGVFCFGRRHVRLQTVFKAEHLRRCVVRREVAPGDDATKYFLRTVL